MALQLHCSNPTLLENKSTCNEKLGLTERHFLLEGGLPKRRWFKHVLQAPGMNLGYAAEAYPGIQQAIDEGNLEVAQEQVGLTAERVESAAKSLEIETDDPETYLRIGVHS
jgi:N-acetylated-alpha-linked acidic dipeptidase